MPSDQIAQPAGEDAGQSAAAQSPAAQSLAAQWNELMLEAIRAGSAKPTATTYQMHLVTAAMYDAWAAYDDAAWGYYSEQEAAGGRGAAAKAEAVSHAAHAMLSLLFPDQAASFDGFMQTLGHDPAAAPPGSAAALGLAAVQGVLAARAGDGSNVANGFADTSGYQPVNSADDAAATGTGGAEFDPNHWQPLRVPNGTLTDENGVPVFDPDDASSYADQQALTPHWGGVTPFALLSGDQFRPPAPPQLGDEGAYTDALGQVSTGDQAWRDQFTEVMEMSAALSTREKVIAEYWADGPRTESPPGHWNQIAQDIALREGHGLDQDIKLFFALNAALLDAGISTWEAKFHYDFIRPQSAIRYLYRDQDIEAWGGPDKGTVTMPGQEWRPYQNVTFVTPPFPEFVSGHSTFSMSAARTIAAFTGSDAFYDGVSHGNYDLDHAGGTDLLGQYVATALSFEAVDPGEDPVVLQWATLTDAAEEAGISRLYGGIHIQDGNLRGQEMGQQIAAQAELRWEALFTRAGNDRLAASDSGGLLVAGPGDDVMLGGTGDDIFEGGSGNDRLRGGDGSNRLEAGAGADTVSAGAGDDLILGGSAGGGPGGLGDLGDLLCAGAGDDTVLGGGGNDRIFGMAGADRLEGGAGSDRLCGQDGNDVLAGGAMSDLLAGGAGDDFLNGGYGHDRLRGGEGADRFFHAGAAGHGTDWIQDYSAPEGDVLVFAGAAAAEDFALSLARVPGAGGAAQEAFVTHLPSGQVLWALADGGGADEIVLRLAGSGESFDLLV